MFDKPAKKVIVFKPFLNTVRKSWIHEWKKFETLERLENWKSKNFGNLRILKIYAKRVKWQEYVLNSAKSVKLRKLEKNTKQEEEADM